MLETAVEKIRAYWESLRLEGDIPLRTAVDPRGIEAALEFAFMVERVAPGVARLRLAGMHLIDLMGMEVRGMPLSAFFCENDRHAAMDMIEAVFCRPEAVEAELTGADGATAQMLLLPLRGETGTVTRALGCLVSKGHAATAPQRFSITHIAHGSLPERASAQPVGQVIYPGPVFGAISGGPARNAQPKKAESGTIVMLPRATPAAQVDESKTTTLQNIPNLS